MIKKIINTEIRLIQNKIRLIQRTANICKLKLDSIFRRKPSYTRLSNTKNKQKV